MRIYGKGVGDYAKFVRVGLIVIVLVGLVRFAIGVSGVPYERATHLVSISIATMLMAIVYGQRAAATGFGRYRHLLPMVVMLALAMYGFIVAAILVEGLGGIHGYFHAPGHGLAPGGMSMGFHISGQLLAMVFSIGGFWILASLGFLLAPQLGFLRRALLLLVAVAVLRVAVGAAGVPYAIGTWLTSLTLAAMALSVYYGYRAPAGGFARWSDVVLLGLVIATALAALVIYGILVTTALGLPSYFHAPGAGFQPAGLTISEHIRGHLRFWGVGAIVMSGLCGVGFAFGRRKRPAEAAVVAS